MHKVVKCKDHWKMYHMQNRYLILNKNGYLIDGYIMYLVLKEQGVEEAEIKQLNRVGIGKKKKKNKVKVRYALNIGMSLLLTYMGIIQNQRTNMNLCGEYLRVKSGHGSRRI